jgi:cyanobactin maturation PatA/PatG family protease
VQVSTAPRASRTEASEAGLTAGFPGPAQTLGDDRICIAILDGPVDLAHPCFRGAKLTTISAGLGGDCGAEPSLHGTHVASLIFGQPGSAVLGVAPRCRGMLIPIFSHGEDGAVSNCSQLDLARAILVAVENGAHIINVSGGQLSQSGEPELLLANAIATCTARNVLIVAAAGNDGCDCLHIPACASSVLPVGAMDAGWGPMPSSNWGTAYRRNGILAPGEAVLGAVPGGVAMKTGTSFATPIVTGIAALLLSLQLELGRMPDPHAAKLALLRSALPCTPEDGVDCRRYLAGRLNVAGAVALTLNGGPEMSDLALLPEREIQASAEPAPEPHAFTPPPAPPMPSRPAIQPSEMRVAAAAPALGRGEIAPSDCGCGCGGQAKGDCGCGGAAGTGAKTVQLVYALGTIGYDFESEARRDSIAQAMPGEASNPLIAEQLLAYLDQNPAEAQAVTWTLNLDATPIYAIQPAGPFAAQGYERLRESLRAQIAEGVEIVSVPGYIAGSARLLSGQTVPVIVPAVRGMFDWSIDALVKQMAGGTPAPEGERGRRKRGSADGQPPAGDNASGLADFLARIYYDLRNLGLTGEERALNFAATNAVQVAGVVDSATNQNLDLDTISVHPSPVCRPGSECYDVEVSFFNPDNMNVANRIFRFTVDVSDVIPVSIGVPRSWTKRS